MICGWWWRYYPRYKAKPVEGALLSVDGLFGLAVDNDKVLEWDQMVSMHWPGIAVLSPASASAPAMIAGKGCGLTLSALSASSTCISCSFLRQLGIRRRQLHQPCRRVPVWPDGRVLRSQGRGQGPPAQVPQDWSERGRRADCCCWLAGLAPSDQDVKHSFLPSFLPSFIHSFLPM